MLNSKASKLISKSSSLTSSQDTIILKNSNVDLKSLKNQHQVLEMTSKLVKKGLRPTSSHVEVNPNLPQLHLTFLSFKTFCNDFQIMNHSFEAMNHNFFFFQNCHLVYKISKNKRKMKKLPIGHPLGPTSVG